MNFGGLLYCSDIVSGLLCYNDSIKGPLKPYSGYSGPLYEQGALGFGRGSSEWLFWAMVAEVAPGVAEFSGRGGG